MNHVNGVEWCWWFVEISDCQPLYSEGKVEAGATASIVHLEDHVRITLDLTRKAVVIHLIAGETPLLCCHKRTPLVNRFSLDM